MQIIIANASHESYAELICDTIALSALQRGTGIAKRSAEYIRTKMRNGNAVIALEGTTFAGFCYIETWNHGKFVVNSGLIVHPDFRGKGLARGIKKKIFDHSRQKFPEAKIFGITTGLAGMKINYDLGYEPVTFSELTSDPDFWKGCQTCPNYDILTRTSQRMCLCTGMLFDPAKKLKREATPFNQKMYNRLKQIKASLYSKKDRLKKSKSN